MSNSVSYDYPTQRTFSQPISLNSSQYYPAILSVSQLDGYHTVPRPVFSKFIVLSPSCSYIPNPPPLL